MMETTGALFDTTKRYQIPVEHLDYKYIEKCNDVKEVEKILRVLRAGDEGKFPDLETFCENRLTLLAPQSRLLRQTKPLLKPRDLDSSTQREYTDELTDWLEQVNSSGDCSARDTFIEKPLPPVRGKGILETKLTPTPPEAPSSVSHAKVDTASLPKTTSSQKKRVMPRDYNEWAKIEKQLDDSDEEKPEEKPAAKQSSQKSVTFQEKGTKSNIVTSVSSSRTVLARPTAPSISSTVEVPAGTSPQERQEMAMREKEKGNEAFTSGDMDEALLYYNRSLSIAPSPAGYNNRALVYLKKRMWHEVVKDTSKALVEEPKNVKALTRRAQAYLEIHSLKQAVADLELVLSLESGNARAQALLNTARKEEEKRAKSKLEGGRRLAIMEEGSSSSEEEEEENAEERNHHEALPPSSSAPEEHLKVHNEEPKPQTLEEPTTNGSNIWNMSDVQETTVPLSTASNHHMNKPPPEKVPKVKIEEVPKSKPAPSTHLSPFMQAKEKGNEEFKKGNYKAALEHYNVCVDVEPENVSGYKNRALCHLKLKNASDAIYDCNMALEVNPNCAHSYFRRGIARKLQGDYAQALRDVEKAQEYLPDNEAIANELRTLMELYKKHPRGERLVEELTVELTMEPVQDVQPVQVTQPPPQVPTPDPTPAAPVTFPTTPISKGFEFTHAWTDLKRVNHQPEYMADFLKRISPPDSLPQIISTQLEPDMLEKMINGLVILMKDPVEHRRVCDIVFGLVKVPRFKMLSLLLPVATMVELKSIVHVLYNEDLISEESYHTLNL